MNQVKEVEFHLLKQPTMKYTIKGSNIPIIPKATKSFKMLGLGRNDKGEVVTICLDPTEESIYLNKHRSKDPKKDGIQEITFEYFRSIVPANDTKTLEFLKRWSLNRDHEGDPIPGEHPVFKVHDHATVANQSMEKDRLYTKAKNLVYEAKDEEILAYALYKSYAPASDMATTRMNIRYTINEDNAQTFINEFTSEQVKRFYRFTDAIDRGIIRVDQISKNLTWADGSIIMTYGTQDPVRAIVDFSMNPENVKIWNQINERKTSEEIEVENHADSVTDKAEVSDKLEVTVPQAVALGIEQKVIVEGKKGGYYFNGKCGGNVENTITHFEKNIEKFNKLKEELGLV